MLECMCHKNQSSAYASCCLLLSCYASVINSFEPILLYYTQFKSIAHVIRLSRSIYLLYRRLEFATMHVRVIVEDTCTWWYIHTRVCQDTHDFTCAWFCVCFISHKRVTCEVFACTCFACILSCGWLVLYVAT